MLLLLLLFFFGGGGRVANSVLSKGKYVLILMTCFSWPACPAWANSKLNNIQVTHRRMKRVFTELILLKNSLTPCKNHFKMLTKCCNFIAWKDFLSQLANNERNIVVQQCDNAIWKYSKMMKIDFHSLNWKISRVLPSFKGTLMQIWKFLYIFEFI